MLRTCTRAVFACFKTVERAGDRITGFAGPVFVGLAWLMLTTGVVYFFHVVAPSMRWPLLSIPFCILCTANLLAHYYYACTVPPGRPDDGMGNGEGIGWNWASRNGRLTSSMPRRTNTFEGRKAPAADAEHWTVGAERPSVRAIKCRKCFKFKPERTHHCRVCNSCILKYDHHCPSTASLTTINFMTTGINQCVGLRNERHFILFMAWLVLSCGFFAVLGYPFLWRALDFTPNGTAWPYILPQTPFILIYVLASALGFAVSIMLLWHLYLISRAETTVENHDFSRYREVAASRETTFVNSYDLGRWRNLRLFFNIVPTGYPIYTLFVPLRCAPYSDGVSWPRKPGYTKHTGIGEADELTDEEDA